MALFMTERNEKKMSLKKRMFRSNMMILLSALVSLMLVVVIVIAIFEDAVLRDFESLDNAELDKNVSKVWEVMKQADEAEWQQLEQDIRRYDYNLLVLKEDRIVYGDSKGHLKKIVEDFNSMEHTDSEPEIFYHQKSTIVGKYIEKNGSYVMAVHFADEEWWISSFRNSFSTFFIAFLVIGAAAIGVLLLLSSFFTKKLSQKVMKPLDELVKGAKRIQDGNLKENIIYEGDEEFENVCNTFNAMQKAMLQNREQRLKDEKARTDMVTGISHDLRTPLTSIRGYIKGILDGVACTDEKKKIYLQTAYEATGEMDVLLQKLFDFSRLESGQMPFHMIKGDLSELIASYVALREVGLEGKQVEITFDKESEVLPDINMDIEQIRRIFDNLLENSMKYAEMIPLKIRIYIYEEESKVIMEWSDNGKGVPEEKLESIFERFYRCDEARTKKGSGVGLYVVKYIVEQHGGDVTAQNEDGLMLRLRFPKGD